MGGVSRENASCSSPLVWRCLESGKSLDLLFNGSISMPWSFDSDRSKAEIVIIIIIILGPWKGLVRWTLTKSSAIMPKLDDDDDDL